MADTRYIDTTAAGSYNSARGISVNPTQEELLRASEYIDARYGLRFPGLKTGGRGQVREWPRSGAVDARGQEIPDDEVPQEIKDATVLVANEVAGGLDLWPTVTPGKAIKRAEVDGAVSVEYRGDSSNPEDQWPFLGFVDALLAGLLGAEQARVGVRLV